MAHTPVELAAERQDDESGEIYWAVHAVEGYEFIANVYSERYARLFQAAPQMLEALEAVRNFLRGQMLEHAVFDVARPNMGLGEYLDAALRAAKGE